LFSVGFLPFKVEITVKNLFFLFRINKLQLIAQLCFMVCFSLSVVFCPTEVLANTKKSSKRTVPKKKEQPYEPPYAHIVVDANTGRVISQTNADASLHPASLTKIMTIMMVFDALDSKKIKLNSRVLISSHAAKMPPSKIGLKAGKTISVEDAIKALSTKSANDISVALGEKLGGSESLFAKMMTAKAREIGMTKTNFMNASGLHNSRQFSSARDMAKLAIYIMRTYPHYYHYFSLRKFEYDGKVHSSHNRLMNSYPGMDGMKTGFIRQSGFNLVSSAKRGNTRLIGVIFGGKTANSRNTQMASLLDRGFGRGAYNADNSDNIIPYRPPTKSQQNAPSQKPILTLAPPSHPSKSFENNQGQVANVLKKPTITYENKQPTPTPNPNISPSSGSWSIQIGAFQDRVSTDQVLYRALKALPAPLNRGNPVIVPLRTADASWVFRARIAGYSREQAIQACRYLDDCLTISPQAN
jgi:D-alanyl-D-alanine carboxypeptidase